MGDSKNALEMMSQWKLVYDAAMARWKWLESDEAEKMNAHEWMMKRAELDLAVDAACERAEEVERG